MRTNNLAAILGSLAGISGGQLPVIDPPFSAGKFRSKIENRVIRAQQSNSSTVPGYMKRNGVRTKGYASHGNGRTR